jgi:phage/plasmid-associated DNA primase
VIDFPNKFVHQPRLTNELPIDETIMEKVGSPEWASCFMAYMVHLFKEGDGLRNTIPPKEVDTYTGEYQEESDVIARFIGETCHTDGMMPGELPDPVAWTTVTSTFQDWKRSNEVERGRGSATDLKKRIEAQFGKMPRGGWTSFRFGNA